MKNIESSRRLGCTLALALLTMAPRLARAQGIPTDAILGLAAASIFIPSETGVLFAADGPRFVLGWSLQVPFREHQSIVGGFNLAPDGGPHDVEGRLGYRHTGQLFGGLGVTLDHLGPSWSPEIGVKIVPWRWVAKSAAVHLLARAEIAPKLDQVRGVSILLGFTLF